MSVQDLLSELEPLTHDDRMRRMVELGRRAPHDSGTAELLNALEQGGFYERLLALVSCYGSGEGARVLRALEDPSRPIRTLAARMVPVCCDDQQALAALLAAPAGQRRRRLAWRLRKRGRFAPIDGLIEHLAAAGDEELITFLPLGSEETVARYLDRVQDPMWAAEWARLANAHPRLAARELLRRAAEAEQQDPRLLGQANAALPVLVEKLPEQALALARTLLNRVPLASLNLQRLAERLPAETADLLLETGDRVSLGLHKVAHRLDEGRLIALSVRGMLAPAYEWLQRQKPAVRAALYRACEYGWRDKEGILDSWIVRLLPREDREREARRILELGILATRPVQRLPYVAFLPWEEALAVVDPYLRNPDADLRSAALGALIGSVRFQRDRAGELLALVRARRNEQDPVRGQMLGALADLPPGMWRAEHLEDLGQILRDALDAADLSYGTTSAAERLIVALLPHQPAWAAPWLGTLVRERGHVSLYDLSRRLSDDDVRRIAPHLLPVLRAWETREREGHLISAAQSLGRRLRVFDELVEILERLLKETRGSYVAEAALRLLGKHRPERLRVLVPELVRQDPSWVTREPVYTYLHRRRQDLITPFLGHQTYRGRFSTGKTRFVLPLRDGFWRWTPSQQAQFAQTLSAVAGDSVRDIPAVLGTIVQLAELPAVPPVRLIELAGDSRAAVRDAALRALGRLDAGEGVPTLLEALGDDRARIAIYAVRTALLEMPSRRALSILQSVPLAKVTVAKEVLRLLGELRTDEAYQELLAADGRDLHRDVRVALVRAFWSHLEREETWPILERAAVSTDAALATIAARTPAERLSAKAQGRLASLIAQILRHPDPVVRKHALDRCGALPVPDRDRVLMNPLLEALASPVPDECGAAARAVFATYAGHQAEQVGRAIQAILANRRALSTAIGVLQGQMAFNRRHLAETAQAVLSVLRTDPLVASQVVSLAAVALPWQEWAGLLEGMTAADELHADALAAAEAAIPANASRFGMEGLEEIEPRLKNSRDERLRRLGLATLVALSGPLKGWDEARVSRLREYRSDPSRLVAAAAQFVFPPAEMDVE